jgi:hypothetical protein
MLPTDRRNHGTQRGHGLGIGIGTGHYHAFSVDRSVAVALNEARSEGPSGWRHDSWVRAVRGQGRYR